MRVLRSPLPRLIATPGIGYDAAMDIPTSSRAGSPEYGALPPRFRVPRFAMWFASALIAATLLAWGATRVSISFAPLLVFPALVGVVLGSVLVLLLRTLEVAHRSSLF